MLTGKQKRYLRAQANHIKAAQQIGKQGITENLITQLNNYLEKHELAKISILQNCPEDKQGLTEKIVDTTESYLVQIIGNNVVLYKPSKENPKIHLPT